MANNTVLRDASEALSAGGVAQGWVRSPYGVRLVEDPNKAFKTLMDIERYVLAEDAEKNQVSTNVQQWLNILNNVEMSDSYSQSLNKDGYQDTMTDGKSLYASPNYTDTRVGGNDAINPYWQFNRDDDIVPPLLRMPGMEAFSSGMGRVYAEMYDDNQEILWMRMGVPEFVDIISFYASTGDQSAAAAMQSGTIRGLIGKFVRFVAKAAVWAIMFPILAPFHLVKWVSHLNNDRITHYYYFKPAMTLYYEMVNSMLSYLAVGMGLYPFWWLRRYDQTKILPNSSNVPTPTPDEVDTVNDKTPSETSKSVSYKNESITMMNLDELAKRGTFATNDCGIPEILKGGPDIFVIMNRRAKLFNAQKVNVTTRMLMQEQLKAEQSSSPYFQSPETRYNRDRNGNYTPIKDDSSKGVWNKFFSALKGTAFGAGDFVGFRIERGVNCTETVSNQTGPTGISQRLNQVAQQKRDEMEDAGGGNLLARIANSVAQGKSIGEFTKNVAYEMLGNLGSAFGVDIANILTDGSGFIDIPEVWKGSAFSKSYSFTIQLRARYGDPTSIFQSIYIPLIMLLCAALPRSVGDNMYTSPFIINAYCKGKFAVPCGMITDMTITRGKDEFGWNNTNLPTAVDVNFSIKDLSPAVFLGMQDIGFFDTFSRNTNMMEYLDTMSALGLSERLYFFPKVMRKFTAACLIKKNTIFSSTYWGSKIGRSAGVRAFAAMFPYSNLETEDITVNSSRRFLQQDDPNIESRP